MKKKVAKKTQKTAGKKITIDQLAAMMSEGFTGLENRITEKIEDVRSDMNSGFKELANKIDTLDHRTIIMKQVIEKDLKTPVRW